MIIEIIEMWGPSYSVFLYECQVSGSLYGALIGSILAYNIADFLGLPSPLIEFVVCKTISSCF